VGSVTPETLPLESKWVSGRKVPSLVTLETKPVSGLLQKRGNFREMMLMAGETLHLFSRGMDHPGPFALSFPMALPA